MHWFAALTPTERVVSLRSADVWNGASSGLNSPAAWDGPAPQNDDGKIPTYVVFGSDQKGKQAVASVPASKDPYNMGESRLWVWFEFGRHASID